ncbi:Wadjet anti-phage system protein JetD domain-containing protein [Lentibacillus salinarum]
MNNPQLIHMSGNIVINKGGRSIDFSLFTPDFDVNPQFFNDCDIESVQANAVITIENLTSYHDYLFYKAEHKLNEIVLYLGGYHNYGRRLILNKLKNFIAASNLSVPFYHWGDIDLHGLYIWKHLRDKTRIDFQPLYMDASSYLRHLDKGNPITKTDLTQMESLLDQEEFAVFHELICQMLNHRKKIEQEAIILK